MGISDLRTLADQQLYHLSEQTKFSRCCRQA